METGHTFSIYLYTTSACHLCELAEQLLASIHPKQTVNLVDIANDDTLMLTYGVKIPVLHRSDTHTELNWPFSAEDIKKFLNK
jgi:Glutaredoxin-like domain (DUF836)